MDGARMVVSSDSYRDRRTFMKSIASDVLSGKCEDGMYYISKAWYVFKFPVTLSFLIKPFCLFGHVDILMHIQMVPLFYGALNYAKHICMFPGCSNG